MEHLKQKKRDYTVIDDPTAIDDTIRNHVDIQRLFILKENQKEKVRFLDYQNGNSLVISFASDVTAKEVRLLTMSDSYVELITQVAGREKPPYPPSTFRLTVKSCRMAADSRSAHRYSFPEKIKVTELVLPVESESKNKILQNMTMKILLLDIEKSLGKYTYGKVFLRNAEQIPPEVQFVQETDILLYLRNTTRLREFIESNKVFFFNKKELMRDMLKRAPTLQSSYRSIIIQPIEYLTLNGTKITLGHIMIASKDRELTEDDLIALSELCSGVFEKMKLINRKSFPVDADVIDISPDGTGISLGDPGIVEKLVSMENMMFSLKFPYQKSLSISGNIVYITRYDEKNFRVGIDFTGSRYGMKLKKMIEINIKNLLNINQSA